MRGEQKRTKNNYYIVNASGALHYVPSGADQTFDYAAHATAKMYEGARRPHCLPIQQCLRDEACRADLDLVHDTVRGWAHRTYEVPAHDPRSSQLPRWTNVLVALGILLPALTGVALAGDGGGAGGRALWAVAIGAAASAAAFLSVESVMRG